jgi:hypothetical protein
MHDARHCREEGERIRREKREEREYGGRVAGGEKRKKN